MSSVKNISSLPPEVLAMFEDAPELAEIEADLREADVDLELDPEFVGGYLKARFVEDIHRIMAARNMKKADLAKALGKSDQYVGRVLKELGNFTLESIAEFACALGARATLTLHESNEHISVLPVRHRLRIPAPQTHYHASKSTLKRNGGIHGEHFAA